MIASLQGVLEVKDSAGVVINVGGVGYRCLMSTSSLHSLGKTGSTVQVETLLQIKNEVVSLYGFTTPEERSLFESLISVSGVGAKFALAILSTYSPPELTKILQAGDDKRLSAVSGIGKKTAQRIILELQGKIEGLAGADGALSLAEAGSPAAEAALALEAMGFSSDEIALVFSSDDANSLDADTWDASELVRQALKRMG